MMRRMRHHGEPCDGWLICTGWPLASPVVPNISHVSLPVIGVEVLPEVGGDGVVGDVAQHARLLAVLDLPERVAAELAVEALLVDRVAAAAVDEDAVLGVGDDLLGRRRSRRARHRRARSACAGTDSCATRWRRCSRAMPSRRCSAPSRGWSAGPPACPRGRAATPATSRRHRRSPPCTCRPGSVRSAVTLNSFEPIISLPTSPTFTKLVPA